MKIPFPLFAVLLALASSPRAEAAIITSISRVDAGDLDPMASEVLNVASLHTGSVLYSNASFTYGTLIPSLIGADYVQTDIGDYAKTDYQLQLTLSTTARVFLLIDDRVTSPTVSMPWIVGLEFADTTVNILTVGSNLPYSLYSAILPTGNVVLGSNGNSVSGNMYTIAAISAVPEPAEYAPAVALLLGVTAFRRSKGAHFTGREGTTGEGSA